MTPPLDHQSGLSSKQDYSTTTTTTTTTSKKNKKDQKKQNLSFFESTGDYRSEAWLEDPKLPLYAKQASLPSLPVPSLEETIATFLPTALPLATSPEQIESLREACRRFPQQAAVLQKRLQQRQNESENSDSSSWLQLWWNRLCYLEYRESNAIHVSYFFQLPDDPILPTNHYNRSQRTTTQTNQNNTTNNSTYCWGIQRAAAVLQATALYAPTVMNGTHPADHMGRGDKAIPLCSTQYKMIFAACRIPQPKRDSYRVYHNNHTNQSQLHAVVAVKGRFYTIPLTEEQTEKNGKTSYKVLSRKKLQSLLQQCIDHEATILKYSSVPKLGWLTSSHRDACVESHSLLLQSTELKDDLEQLQSALCVMCLDFDDEGDDNENRLLTEREFALRLWHGNETFSANRWFDKSIQFVVSRQGNLGLVGEHSMADGMPSMGLARYIQKRGRIDYEDDGAAAPVPPVHEEQIQSDDDDKSAAIQPVSIFTTSFESASNDIQNELKKRVQASKEEFTNKIQKYDLHVQDYRKYGKNAIIEIGYSPDAYVQMAMQVAGSRVFRNGQQVVATYEAVHTRRFRHGRTETTRSVSPESQAFIEAMNGCTTTTTTTISKEEKIELLKQACAVHTTYTVKALEGKGVDRHFFGLQMCVNNDEKVPDLFSHPVFQQSKRWLMSTSTVPGCAPGFGNVEPDGVGLGYEILNDGCVFTVTANKDTGFAEQISHHLATAMDEMMQLHGGDRTTSVPDRKSKM